VKWFAFVAVVICTGLFAWTVWYDRSLREEDPFGYRNLKACPKIAPGATEAELVRTFGAPEQSTEGGGVRLVRFHTHRAAATPIRADVDAATGRVLALRCAGDDTPAWTARP
jgi:hypothetical protein